MTNVTRQSVNDEINRQIEAGHWDVIHDHSEPTDEGKFFRMVVMQSKPREDNPQARKQINVRVTTHWSNPVTIFIDPAHNGRKTQISLNWSSGGTVPGTTNEEIAYAMVTMWAWIHNFLLRHE